MTLREGRGSVTLRGGAAEGAGHAAGAAGAMGAAEQDVYRDTWVRYMGYANEVGESFRALVPVPVVWASYGVATAYVTADAIDKGRRAATDCGFPDGFQPPQALRDTRRAPDTPLSPSSPAHAGKPRHCCDPPTVTPRSSDDPGAAALPHTGPNKPFQT
ncbi:mitochondrial fission process protein 1 isoform X2 [Manacus candei]|uniref:mitochondrial fission process protein 1 isoform X2 n=1 Tax=Manacus candei TaxID=415023 RepID=UPI0022262FAE|nr:mitochondrial fission process protein 1 isoform X2 [Manacus candei]